MARLDVVFEIVDAKRQNLLLLFLVLSQLVVGHGQRGVLAELLVGNAQGGVGIILEVAAGRLEQFGVGNKLILTLLVQLADLVSDVQDAIVRRNNGQTAIACAAGGARLVLGLRSSLRVSVDVVVIAAVNRSRS